MRKFRSTTYTKANFEQIAIAIGTTVKPVADLEAQFEAAALWFRLDKGRPKRPAPSKQHEKLTQVAKSASRLLNSLGIDDADNAADGPGDHEIFRALVLAGEPDENAVLEATRRIGRLVEIFEGVVAVGELERRAHQAATELAAVGKLTIREGNPGDDAVTGSPPCSAYIAPSRARSQQPQSGRPCAPMKGKRQVPSFGFFRPLANH